jgi:hypothetical protein
MVLNIYLRTAISKGMISFKFTQWVLPSARTQHVVRYNKDPTAHLHLRSDVTNLT